MSMTPDTVMRTWFEEVWNQGREEVIYQFMRDDTLAYGLPGGPSHGPNAFKSVFTTFRGAFPDIHIVVERTVTEGEVCAAYCHVTGTHTGDALGIPPTGKRVDFHGVTIARVSDGILKEGWNCFDFLTMYQQLGAVQVPGA